MCQDWRGNDLEFCVQKVLMGQCMNPVLRQLEKSNLGSEQCATDGDIGVCITTLVYHGLQCVLKRHCR